MVFWRCWMIRIPMVFWGVRVGKIIGSILVPRLMIPPPPHHQQNNWCQGLSCNKKFCYCLCSQIMYFPRKERQKEHSTDRQTQPRRQTRVVGVLYSLGLLIKRKTERTQHRQADTTKKTDGYSRSSLFFRLTYKKKDRKNTAQTGRHNQ